MSENDLIRRGDAVLAVTAADKECLGANGAREFIRALPAAPTFTAADLERAWEMGRDACIGILECELELARAADRTTALVLAITCRAMNGETPPADLAQRVKECGDGHLQETTAPCPHCDRFCFRMVRFDAYACCRRYRSWRYLRLEKFHCGLSKSHGTPEKAPHMTKPRVKPLVWDVDGRSLHMDHTMAFSKSYNWDGLDCCRQEGYGIGASYIIWPDSIGSEKWNLYGTADGLFVTDLRGEGSAKAAAQADYEARILSALDLTPDPAVQALVEARAAWEAFKYATDIDDHFDAVERLDAALAAFGKTY